MEHSELARKAIERNLARRAGMSMAHREALKVFNAEQTDWYGTCQKCGVDRVGTMAELASPHGCEGVTNG